MYHGCALRENLGRYDPFLRRFAAFFDGGSGRGFCAEDGAALTRTLDIGEDFTT